MANSLLDPEHSALLAEQSRVRALVRRMLWEEYPAHASPRVVEGVCRIVFRAARDRGHRGGCGDARSRVIGAGMVGSSTAMRIGEARLADRIAIVDVREGVAQAMALDITQALAAAGSRRPLRRGLARPSDGADVVVLTAGLPRSPGQSRADLLAANGEIVADVLPRDPRARAGQRRDRGDEPARRDDGAGAARARLPGPRA